MRSRTRVLFPAAALLALALAGGHARALPGDQDQPIDIQAQGAEIDDGRHVHILSGNVVITQGSMRLWADRVTVHQKQSRRPDLIVAEGSPARYRQLTDDGKEIKASAGRIEYDANSNELVLIGDARLTQDQDTFSSDRILYDRGKSMVKAGASAQGKQRVHITIDPGNR